MQHGTSTLAQGSVAPAHALLARLGGPASIVSSTLPVVAFVAVSSGFGLIAALTAALLTAAALMIYRLARRDSLWSSLAGFAGVAVAATVAVVTGEGRDFYVIGIWKALALSLICVVSVLVRRPLVGYLWAWGSGANGSWRAHRSACRMFAVATLCWATVFAARFGVQQHLYLAEETAWLGIARIGMGIPLTVLAVGVSLVAMRSVRAALTQP